MKKRIMLTLDAGKYEECQKNLKELGLPPGTLSAMVSDMLTGISNMLQMQIDSRAKGKQLTLQDVVADSLVQIGKVMKDDEGK